jgi:hypothetical protein
MNFRFEHANFDPRKVCRDRQAKRVGRSNAAAAMTLQLPAFDLASLFPPRNSTSRRSSVRRRELTTLRGKIAWAVHPSGADVCSRRKPAMSTLVPGRYRHYKGKFYEVIGVATHSETLEQLVVYQQDYGDRSLWVRPRAMFEQLVAVEGKQVPRFARIAETE